MTSFFSLTYLRVFLEGVLTMESIKQKLIFCMEDHKREINARREKTKAQLKIIHDELHNLMMQRKKLILQIDKVLFTTYCQYSRSSQHWT